MMQQPRNQYDGDGGTVILLRYFLAVPLVPPGKLEDFNQRAVRTSQSRHVLSTARHGREARGHVQNGAEKVGPNEEKVQQNGNGRAVLEFLRR